MQIQKHLDKMRVRNEVRISMSDICQCIDRGTEHVQVFWGVKPAKVTKLVQETLDGKKKKKLLTF